jgi:glycerol-3-phosphate acyltransferase PlsY
VISALLIGYFAGSLPTADLVGRIRGVDLRASGSGNPGAANALRVGGRGMAITVLVLDLIKGAAAALIGAEIHGDGTAVAAAVAAVLGQVHNPWFGFRGGKGLGVTAGTALVLWPSGLLVAVPVLAIAAKALRAAAGSLDGSWRRRCCGRAITGAPNGESSPMTPWSGTPSASWR